MAKITVNGKEAEVAAGETLRSLLQGRHPGAKNLVLEWNGKILTLADQLETCELRDGDAVNLFSMVGGG